MADTPVVPDEPADVASLSFEEAMAGLETIVRRLESGESSWTPRSARSNAACC
jgi:hypothetical protein